MQADDRQFSLEATTDEAVIVRCKDCDQIEVVEWLSEAVTFAVNHPH